MPDMGTVVAITFWFVLIAVVLNFVALCAGLLAVVTGRSYAPPAWHRLRRHIPASRFDQRLTGMSLSLLAVGQLLMMVSLMVVITLATAQATGGRAPIVGLYLVTLIAFAAAVACTFASLFIGQRVRYANVIGGEEEEEPEELVGTPLD
jgi:hypothetical protein